MKTIILAGGYATRLQPLTIDQPKHLLHVADRPILDYLIEKLEPIPEVSEIFVITNEKFHKHFEKWAKEKKSDKKIHIINDGTTSNKDRLWSLGDIQFLLDKEDINEDIFVIGWDNLFCSGLEELCSFFREHGTVIGLHNVGNLELAKQYGNVTIGADNLITNFVEKPQKPTTSLSSTLIWILEKELLHHIQSVINSGKSDRAWDLIADICDTEKVYWFEIPGKWFDIGTLEQLEEADQYFKNYS